ncbi:iron complex outermembrane receptor protein [Hephaestia caeni]|uniref:Iron complex outermembrane receptor protein n=1 Tax=Hephaestia caeni TaxID=645617 RepID=A0A397PF78_9SPHN|nr:TonB-dependent receptor [Hephaestia caeni]RIA44331.1 iron complex outermembrane receptor protein [Hephaestia caeni]
MERLVSIAVLCASVSFPAMAQTVPPVGTSSTVDAEAAAPAPGDPDAMTAVADQDNNGIGDIVVTATRREERLQKIPVTVTAITGGALESSGVLDTRQLTQVVPGLVGSRNAGVNQPVIRGVGSGGVVGDESSIATYIDGVYQPDPWTTNLDLVEIQRVEVLRGPQGTLFGRNATGGLINIITPDPSFDFRGHVAATAGVLRGAGDYDLRGYMTGGLSDKFAMDFAGLYKKTDNYITDLVHGGKRYGEDEYYSLRSKLLFRPSDSAQFVLTGDYAKRDGGSNANQIYQNNTVARSYPGVILPTGPWQAAYNYDPQLNLERFGITLQSRLDIGAIRVETASSYQNGEIYQQQDRDSTNINLGLGQVDTRQRTFSQEVRVLSDTPGPFQWLAGAYYYTSHLDGIVPTTTPAKVPPPTLPTLSTTTTSPDVRVSSLAGFAEGTYSLTSTLFLTAGGRYTTEVRKFEQATNGVPLFPQQRSRFDKFTYRGALRWQFAPDANIYLNYGTGFKSGVYNGVGTSPTPTRPENLTSIEGGIKADPARWLRTNLSVFHYDYKDLQVSARDPITNLVLLQNAATAKIYGGELELTLVPMHDLNLTGKFSYLHGEYGEFPLAQGFTPNPNGVGNTAVIADVSGNRIVLAPRTAVNLAADWSHAYAMGRIGARLNFYHSDRIYYDFTNNFSQKPYSLLNGQISFTPPDEKFVFTLAMTNITNTVVFQSLRVSPNGTDGILEKPRELKGTIRFNF